MLINQSYSLIEHCYFSYSYCPDDPATVKVFTEILGKIYWGKEENWRWSLRQEAHVVPMEECSPFKRRPAFLKVFYLKSFAGGRRPTEQAVIGKGCSAYPDSLHAWCWLKPPFCLTTDWEHTINRATAWQEKWRELFSVASSARLNNEQAFFLSSPSTDSLLIVKTQSEKSVSVSSPFFLLALTSCALIYDFFS